MCDASGVAIRAVLGQRHNKTLHPIYYASKTLNGTQMNYTVTEQELFSIVYAFERFQAYLLVSKVIVYADHDVLRYLITKKDAKPRLIRSVGNIMGGSFLFCICADNIIRQCVPEDEVMPIFKDSHDSPLGGHYRGNQTAAKVLECGFYWPSIYQDANQVIKACDQCQRQGSISKRHEMPMNFVMEVEIFDVWGIDFMGPFVSSYGMTYIFVAMDYITKWVEAITFTNN
uniref:Uncharacterized protein LOC104236745 n=1 Tax=Nicotiana sylvestris TaxID=4096 RepID=A0A1U7XQ37_NICSY|nr:PREDICTED: uncharacterized protein LOC104236745 [Nicotiana sylvestris]